MEDARRKKVREHPAALKELVLTQCERPGASVAAVAREHGLNANLVHTWRRLRRDGPAQREEVQPDASTSAVQFIALPLQGSTRPAPAAEPSPGPTVGDIRLELKRSGLQVSVAWPMAAAAECAAWLREVLR